MANTSTQCSTSHNDSMETDSQNGSSVSGGRTLSQQYLKDLFKKEWKLYYRTPELNEKLFLHYKGKKQRSRTFLMSN
jgi:hypothetical protein